MNWLSYTFLIVCFCVCLYHSARWVKESFQTGYITVVGGSVSLCDPMNCVIWSIQAHCGVSIGKQVPGGFPDKHEVGGTRTESWLTTCREKNSSVRSTAPLPPLPRLQNLGLDTSSVWGIRELCRKVQCCQLDVVELVSTHGVLSWNRAAWKGTELRVKGLLLEELGRCEDTHALETVLWSLSRILNAN